MEKQKLVEKLVQLKKELTQNELETAIGLPKNSLSNVLKGKKEMPNKWVEKIQKYFSAKDAAGLKSVEYEIPTHDKNWTTELSEEIERLKKENAELRPDAMAWRNRMQSGTAELKKQGEVKVTTYPTALESNYSINTHPSKFMEEQRKKKLGF